MHTITFSRRLLLLAVLCLGALGAVQATVGASVTNGSGYPLATYPAGGTVTQGTSSRPSISENARYVTFVSTGFNTGHAPGE